MDGIIKTEWVPIIGSTKEEGEDSSPVERW